jgi:hypothetical protein
MGKRSRPGLSALPSRSAAALDAGVSPATATAADRGAVWARPLLAAASAIIVVISVAVVSIRCAGIAPDAVIVSRAVVVARNIVA